MKKYIFLFLLCSMLLIMGVSTIVAPVYYKGYPAVRVFVDGNELVSLDVPAFQIDGRTMVPLRMVGEALGVTVDWDQESQAVRLTRPVVEDPKRELIEISALTLKNITLDYTEISGKVHNKHNNWVDLKFTVYFYDDRGEMGHTHVFIDVGPESTKEFNLQTKGDFVRYTRKEIIIDELKWGL